MSETIKVVERWFEEVWNKGRVEAIDELLSDDCNITGLGDTIRCRDDYKDYFHQINSIFDGINIKLDRLVVNGFESCGMFTLRATHRATGKEIGITGACWAKVIDGKIVEAENIVDFMHLLMGLDLIPEDSMEKAFAGEQLF